MRLRYEERETERSLKLSRRFISFSIRCTLSRLILRARAICVTFLPSERNRAVAARYGRRTTAMRPPRFRFCSSQFMTRSFTGGALGSGCGFGAGAAAGMLTLIAQLPSVNAAATPAAMHLVLSVFGLEGAVISASVGLADDPTLTNGSA